MNVRAALTFGQTGQELELVPPQVYEGVPSSASVRIWRGRQSKDETPELTPATVTIDATSVLLSGAAGYSQRDEEGGRKRIPVPSTSTLVVGRHYLMESPDAQRELVRLSRVQLGTFAEADTELAYDYPTTGSGSRIRGVRITAVIDDVWIADESNLNDPGDPYGAEWRYTIADKARRFWTYFDVVRAAIQCGVTPQDIFRAHPDLQYVQPKGREGGRYWLDIIARSVELVKRDYRKHLPSAHQVYEGEIFDNHVLLRSLLEGAKDGCTVRGRDVESFIRDKNRDYWDDLNDAMQGPKVNVSQNKEGAITEDPSLDLWCKS